MVWLGRCRRQHLCGRIWSICSICRIVNIEHMLYIPLMNAETTYPVKKLVNLTEEQAERISSFRYEGRIPSENEAIRRLIELGLEKAKEAGNK